MKRRLALVLVASTALTLAAAPGARAVGFQVNSTADTGDATPDGSCDSGGGVCTLREAIDEANDTGAADSVTFATAPFNGMVGTATITTSGLTITQPLTIVGGDCGTPTVPKPCVGLDAMTVGFTDLLTVSADNVTVRNIAFTNANKAIAAGSAVDFLSVTGSRFGTKLDGTAAANTFGVATTGTDAAIGGETVADRNVFAPNSGTAVAITGGGDNNLVLGNYFGVNPDGTLPAGGFGVGIKIAGTTTGPNAATGNQIGGPDIATPTICDGVCNLIANMNLGIYLVGGGAGEIPAGQTSILGNFIGLDSTGTFDYGSGGYGIDIGNADQVEIGAAGPSYRNYISGNGAYPLASGPTADDLAIRNNFIGLNATGTAAIPNGNPPSLDAPSANPAIVSGNRIAGAGRGLELFANVATVKGNVIGIGTGGQDVGGAQEGIVVIGSGNQIGGAGAGDGNTIGNFGTGISVNLDADNTTMSGNLIGVDAAGISHPNSGDGIQIGRADSTTVGGATAASENVISNSGDDAIAITETAGFDAIQNTIIRNRGNGNGAVDGANGLFVDLADAELVGDGFGPGSGSDSPNNGIVPPTITAFSGTSISGAGAVAGATINVYKIFTQNGSSTSGIRGFVTSAVDADGGAWAITLPSLPTGQCAAITQDTPADGTSELRAASTAVGGGACDVTGPTTTIDISPSDPTSDSTPTVGFSSDTGTTFECRYDAALFAPCGGPTSHTPTTGLAEGPHTFEVRGTDPVGNTGPVASVSFTVDLTAPLATIVSGPSGPTGDSTPTFGFSTNDPSATVQCGFDGALGACSGPGASHTPAFALPDGAHTFRVRAEDTAENVGATASRSFSIDATAPETTIAKGPKRKTTKRKARLEFSSSEPGSSFQCKLDKRPLSACSSPATFKKLKPGRHTLQVVASDALGNADLTPALLSFRVLG